MSAPTPPRALYFAYGSNLSTTQMKARCHFNPKRSSVPVAIAQLPDWTWIICSRGYANVLAPTTPPPDDVASLASNDKPPKTSNGVYGLLYDLDPADEDELDGYEGVDRRRKTRSTNVNGNVKEDLGINNIDYSAWPTKYRPTFQGRGAYNKWYVPVRVVKWLQDPEPYASSSSLEMTMSLIYVDELRTAVGPPRDEYVGRMNRAMRECKALGVPQEWIDRVVRKFVPKDRDEIDARAGKETGGEVDPGIGRKVVEGMFDDE